jgi:hypothetical protein
MTVQEINDYMRDQRVSNPLRRYVRGRDWTDAIRSDIQRLEAANFRVHTIAVNPELKLHLAHSVHLTHRVIPRPMPSVPRPDENATVGGTIQTGDALFGIRLVEDDATETYAIAVHPT